MGVQDDKFLDLIQRRRPGMVVDLRGVLRSRYGKNVRIARPRGSVASVFAFHHSASPERHGADGALASTWDYHVRSLGWATGGYAILVDQGGVIYICASPFADMTYNAGERWNPITAAVCSVGNFQTAEPSPALLQSLYSVGISLDDASGVRGGRPWRPHGALKQTACPGKNLIPHIWKMTSVAYGAATNRPEVYP